MTQQKRSVYVALACGGLVLLGGAVWAQARWGNPGAGSGAASPELGPLPESGACVSIDIRHEEKNLGLDGVQRRSEYVDRMVRCADKVWTERTKPELVADKNDHGHDHGHQGHHHKELPPLHKLAKLVSRSPDGKTELLLVDLHEKRIIEVPEEEFDSVGFDGSWDAALHLVREETRGKMRVASTDAAQKLRRLEHEVGESFARVTWSDALELPLEIRTGTKDGRVEDVITLHVRAIDPKETPWRPLGDFARSQISDYRD